MACTHSASTELMDRSEMIDGSATLTIVVSMMTIASPRPMKTIGVQPICGAAGSPLGVTD